MPLIKRFILLFIMFTGINANAQFQRFGIRSGVLFTDWIGEKTIDENIQYNGKVGSFIGVYGASQLGSHFDIEYGLNFAWKGFKISGQLMVPGVQFGANLTNQSIYTDVPIAIRYVIGDNSPSGIYLKAGVQFSYLVFNKIDGNVLYNGTNYYGDPDNNANELNRFDLCLYPAFGYQFESGLSFELCYEYGLINCVKDEDYLGVTSGNNSVLKIQIAIDL